MKLPPPVIEGGLQHRGSSAVHLAVCCSPHLRGLGQHTPPNRAGGMKHATKEAWARAQAAEARAKYELATDPSVRAQLMQDMARYEGMASTYKRKGI